MAEGDSILRLASRLHRSFAGLPVQRSSVRRRVENPALFDGDRLVEVGALGKHLLMRFDSGRTLHSHLRMQGAWRIHRAPPRGHRVSAWFDFGERGVLVAHAMPVLDVVRSTEEHLVVGHLGPDILSEDWPRAVAVIEQQAERRIREALLDQRNTCGIGNLWAVEGLFVAGVWPHAPVAEVDVARLLDLIARMMRLGLRNRNQVTTGNTRRGETHWVYGRYRRPCRRCGTPIAFSPAGGGPYDRETWWCPHCQPPV